MTKRTIVVRKGVPRLPLTIVFDIDHTILSYVPSTFLGGTVLPPGAWCPAPSSATLDPPAPVKPPEAATRMLAECYERVWCTTLQYNSTNALQQQHAIALRPHVVSFFRRLLVDRALDTDRIRVDASLWTRRPKSYAQVVAAEVLQPLVMRHGPGADDDALLVRDTQGGEMCSNKEEHVEGFALGPAGLTPLAGSHSGWKKSILAYANPFTTLLIDDKSENFIPWECRTGHCVHVPSFRPLRTPSSRISDAEPVTPDRLFFSPMEKAAEDDGLFVEQCLLSGSNNNNSSDDGVTLFDLVKSFVDTCDRHAAALHAVSAPRRTSSSFPLCADAATSDILQHFNLFEHSDPYRDVWERFHSQHGTSDALVPFFYC